MSVEIRNLKTFLQVADMRNFTRAAQVLGYSQSNVTAQVQQLESELGVRLFDRIAKCVSLTQYGQEFLPYAQQVVAAAIRAENFATQERMLGGTIRIGMVESLFNAFFLEILAHYRKGYPNVKLSLTVDTASALREMIRRNELDLIYLIDYPILDMDWMRVLEKEELIAVIANPMSRLNGKRDIALKELVNEAFISMEGTASYQTQFNEILAREHLSLEPFLELQSASMAVELVAQNNYITIVPLYTARTALEAGAVVVLDIANCFMTKWAQLIHHRDKVLTPQLQGFIEATRRVSDANTPLL